MNLITGIERDHNVVNNVSKRVRSQYEENPYPRWQNPKGFSSQTYATYQKF